MDDRLGKHTKSCAEGDSSSAVRLILVVQLLAYTAEKDLFEQTIFVTGDPVYRVNHLIAHCQRSI